MAQENKSKVSILTNGIIKENPVLRLVLGTCSILAVTTAVSSALGMGAAFTFVLVCSNIMISLQANISARPRMIQLTTIRGRNTPRALYRLSM